jgi:hypothetical protein
LGLGGCGLQNGRMALRYRRDWAEYRCRESARPWLGSGSRGARGGRLPLRVAGTSWVKAVMKQLSETVRRMQIQGRRDGGMIEALCRAAVHTQYWQHRQLLGAEPGRLRSVRSFLEQGLSTRGPLACRAWRSWARQHDAFSSQLTAIPPIRSGLCHQPGPSRIRPPEKKNSRPAYRGEMHRVRDGYEQVAIA